MKRTVLTAGGTAVIVTTLLSGCSSSGTASTPGQTVSTSGHAKVVIDGQDQNAKGQVVCQKAAGQLQIGIGQPGSPGAIAVQATDADPPAIHQIALGTVNGVALAYQQGTPGVSAQSSKNGNGYKFTGTATGVDKSNPMQPLTKPFDIEVTCP